MLPTYDASKVTASGPGLSSYGIPASLPVEFAVDAKDAGQGLLAVQITVSNYNTNQEWKHLVLGGHDCVLSEVSIAVLICPEVWKLGWTLNSGTGESCTLHLWGFYGTAVCKVITRAAFA